jgi:putative endonuclease
VGVVEGAVMHSRRKKGNKGERIACDYLRSGGYQIVATQWSRLPFGEIDIIARERDSLVFIEVKARSTDWFGTPEESVTWRKRVKISRLIDRFLQEYRIINTSYRFDIIGIQWVGERTKIQHLKSVGIDA